MKERKTDTAISTMRSAVANGRDGMVVCRVMPAQIIISALKEKKKQRRIKMKITVELDIECDGKNCGKCRFFDRIFYEDDVDDNCRLFKKSLNERMSESTMRVRRLPECIKAGGK